MKENVKDLHKKTSLLGRIKKELFINRYLYILAVPVVLYYLLFCFGPMSGVIIAFKNYQLSEGIFGSEWVGFKYFKEFFKGMYFTRTLRNTLLISLYDIIFGFPIPIVLH